MNLLKDPAFLYAKQKADDAKKALADARDHFETLLQNYPSQHHAEASDACDAADFSYRFACESLHITINHCIENPWERGNPDFAYGESTNA